MSKISVLFFILSLFQLALAEPAPAGNAAPTAPDPYLVELQRKNFASAEEALNELEKKRKWELIALEIYTNKIGAFRRQLKGKPDLPNLEIVKAVQTAEDAELLNLWYKYGVHRAHQEIYDAIGRKAGWEKDARFVFLRLLCGRRLNRDKTELLKLCDILIALEPNNQRFNQTKLTFEMN